MVYQIDVKSDFLYGTIEEEVYVCQPQWLEDPDHLDKVYKEVKALYGLHQAPRVWYETLANYLLENGFQRDRIDQTLFIKRQKGLQVKQKKDGIFISQDKYIAEILRKFGLTNGKSASTPIDTEKPLLKDPDGEDVDVHTYRSMIGSLMYLTSSRPDIMFAIVLSGMESLKRMLHVTNILSTGYLTTQQMILNLPCLTHITNWLVQIKWSLAYVTAVSSQVSAVRLMLLLLVQKFLLFGLTNWCCSLSAVRVETPLFEGMLVEQEVKEGDANENVENVNAGDAAEGDVSVANDEVPTVAEEPSIPSPTLPKPPPQPSKDIPSTSQAQPTPPQSPQGRMIAKMDQDADVVLEDEKQVADEEIYKIDLEHANKVLSMLEDESEPAEVQEVVDVVTTAKIITDVVTAANETITAASTTITAAEAQVPAATFTTAPARDTASPNRRRKRVLIRDPQEESTTSTIRPVETKSKDKSKEILVEQPKPLKKQAQIEQDEQYARELEAELNRIIDWDEVIDHVKIKAKEDPTVKRYQALKRKPQTEAQARKNMMIYLKNVAGFKMYYFKGMTYNDIRPIFEAKFDSNVAFLQKTKEQIEEEESRTLKRINETPAEKVAKRQSWMRREDLEALWSLVKEKFATTKPKNFSNDFLLITLGAMFKKPYIHAQIWKNQRSVYGPAKVKGWKLLESCSVQIITFTTAQLILLVERKYPLTRFTLDQMLNAVRLEVKEESKVF
nr:hypothetical protein [Tanacetum cinerariifolium]